MNQSKKILVAPLSWGIGHASRCIPVITELLKLGFTPIIATDSDAYVFLKKEFSGLKFYRLPAYNIKYSTNAFWLPFKLFLQVPSVLKTIRKEHTIIQEIIKKENPVAVISDNRFGCWSRSVPSIYITHQVRVLSGFTTFLTSKIHQKIIKKFDYCWIPDDKKLQLSGKMSTVKRIKKEYTGILSRFELPEKLPKKKYDVLVLLSGPEPQRSILEKKLIDELSNSNKKVLFVRGVFLETAIDFHVKNIQFINYLLKDDLQKSILESDLILARSGYSTIMDLAVLGKKCFLIPTPNQTEQVYLAKRLDKLKIAPFSTQQNFRLEKLNQVKDYQGFISNKSASNLKTLLLKLNLK